MQMHLNCKFEIRNSNPIFGDSHAFATSSAACGTLHGIPYIKYTKYTK